MIERKMIKNSIKSYYPVELGWPCHDKAKNLFLDTATVSKKDFLSKVSSLNLVKVFEKSKYHNILYHI